MDLSEYRKVFPDNIREELFIKIRQSYIKDGTWANWSKATKAIVPVIMKYSDACGHSFPSQKCIAIYSGITEKSVRQGLNGLQDFQDFEIKNEFNKRGWKKNKYWLRPANRIKGESVFISHAFFNGANWALLSQSAKAIYPVLKFFSFWDFELYQDYEETGEELYCFNDAYKDRKYDFINADPEAISEFSGVSKRSLPSAFQSLESKYFLEPLGLLEGRKTWRLFTNPPYVFNTYMNGVANERYNLLEENITY